MKINPSDILTLANAISITGFTLAVHGANSIDTPRGLAETAVGRTLDLADGYVARATGQASEFGAAVDATLDKLAGVAIIASEWRKGTAPKPALAAITAQNVLNSVATGVAIKRHPDMNMTSTKDGKYAMAAQNVALAAYAGADILKTKHPLAGKAMRALGHTATVVGVGYYGARATYGYIQRARQ
jgi:phosphatidylglycerophosphate synthase